MFGKLKLDAANGPVDISDLERAEQQIGAKLPLDYKSFLLKFNGGKVIQGLYITYENQKLGTTKVYPVYLYGVESDVTTSNSDSIQFRVERSAEWLPNHLLPIARTLGDHMHILISLDDATYGNIFAVDDQAPFSESELHHLADSFNDFVELLEDEPVLSLDEIRARRRDLQEQLKGGSKNN
ncbi:MAG: SMI1/KNR4 family protein [Chloroflexota bacterium]